MAFSFDELKFARERGYSDDEIWNIISSENKEIGLAKERGYSLDEVASIESGQPMPSVEVPEPEPSGFLRQAADIPIQFAKGVGSAVRGYTDLFGADNEVSKSIAGYEDYMDSILSAESKKDSKRVAELLQKAQDGGFLDKVAAGFEAFASAPAEMTANTLGYMVPQVVFGVAGKAAQLSKAAQVGLTIGTGFAQGVGMGKGNIYQGTKDYLREQGIPEDQVETLASQAQEYGGKNLDQILVSGGLNALAASTGAEAILTRVLSKQGKEASGGIIKGILKGSIAEAPIEGVQSAQEAIAPNIALQREGFDVPTFRGAIESATTGVVAGGLIGGGAGAIEAMSPEQKALIDIEKEANRRMRDLDSDTPAAQALSTEITRLERGIDNKRQDLDALESTSPEASSLRLDIAADQKKLATLKTEAPKFGLSEPITEAERQQAELAKAIVEEPAPTEPLPVPPAQAAPVAEAVTPVAAPVEQVVTPPVEVAPTIAEAAPVEPITPAPTEEAAPAEVPATKQAIASATNIANQIEEENKVLEQQKKFSPPTTPTLQDARSLPDAIAKKGKTLSISGGKQEKNILDPKESKKRFDEIGYERQALELPEDMNDRVSGRYGNAIANIKSLYSLEWLGAHFHGGVAVNPEVKGTQRGRIVAHELGHASHSLLGDKINKDQNVLNELQAIEELLYPGLRAKVLAASNPDASFFNYLLSPNELIAEFNVERVSNPERAAQVAPALSALLESAEKMKGLVADRKTFPTIMGVIRESKERLKVKGLESRKIKETTGDVLKNKINQLSNTAKFVINRTKQGELDLAKTGLRNLKREKATKEFAKRTAELTGNQELIDYVEELYPAEAAPIEPVTPAPVTEQAAPAEAPAPEAAKDYATGDINTPFYFENDSWKVDESRLKSGDEVIETSDGPAIYSRTNDGKVVAIGVNANGRQVYIGESSNSFMPSDYANVPISEMFSALKGSRTFESDRAGDLFPAIDQKTAEKLISKYPPTTPSTAPAVSETITPAAVKTRLDIILDEVENTGSEVSVEVPEKNRTREGIERMIKAANDRGLEASFEGRVMLFRPPIRPTTPEGIAVGNRIKLGRSPQTYTIEEVIPQTDTERANNEQYYSVKNDKTGETQVVEKADMKPVKRVKKGEAGGVLIPTKEDFIQAGQNIYEAGMEFKAWAEQMIQRFGDAVREFLGEVWQAVSGAPAKLNELMGYLPKKGEAGAVNVGKGKIGEKAKVVEKPVEEAKVEEKPTEEAKAEKKTPVKRGQVASIKNAGPEKKTPKQIIAKTKEVLRQNFFNPAEVTEENTLTAFRALGKLVGPKKEAAAYAEELNDIGRLVDEEGVASEVSMGAILFTNDLFEYSIKLAAEGQKMMLGIMMSNMNRLPLGEGVTLEESARAMRGALERSTNFTMMGQAEQDAFANYVAEFIYGPNPTKEQVQSIKDAYSAVDKTEEITAEELTDELDEVGKKTGTDLVAKIEDEIAQATSTAKDPIVAAMLALQKLGGGTIETKYLPYSKRASSRFEGVKKILKGGLSNYRQKMVEGAATGLETGFWKTLSNEENKPGSLGELDAAQNRELGSIVKSMLISLGLKGTPPNTKMSIYEQVASILGEKPLSQDKIKLADENIRAEIKRKREKELDDTEDSDEQDAINVKYDGIENAWDKAMAQQLDMPISESTLRRLIFNELKEENTSIVKLVKMMDENPNDAISKQDGLINAIIEKISKIKFVYPSSADYTLLKENLENQLQGLIQERLLKEAAAKAKAKIAKEAKGSVDLQAEKAENEAQKQIDEFAKIQSDTISWFVEAKPAKQKVESVLKTIRKAIRDALKLDAGEANDFVQKWKPAFIEKLVKLGVKDSSASILASVVGRQIEVNSMSKKIELQQNEVDSQMQKIQNQAKSEIGKLAKIQSDTPSFEVKLPSEAKMNPVREAVKNALKLNLNKMFDPKQSGEIISNFKKSFVKELKGLGVEETAANILADVVGRQIEINSLNNQLKSIDRAIEKGSISEIVKAIKDTPLEEQQKPNWRYEVMRDYLRKAGLTIAQSERIAKLMDISLQKRFTMAQEEAFTQAISKTAPWKAGDTRSRRAFQKVLQALRAGALDPAKNVLSDMAALNGWTGFTPEQYKSLLKYDAILADPKTTKADLAEAHKAIQNIISKAKLPIRARDVIGQYYDAQALSGITTMTVNIFSPAGVAVRNALVQSLNGLVTARPDQITTAMTTFVDSIKSWANTVAYSFKNNVTVYSNVEYLVNDEGLLKLYNRGVDQFNNGKTPRERADGVKNMMIGMMDYVRRVLNALDYGAIASLQNQAVPKYALAAMQAKGMSSADGTKMLNAMMEQKRIFYTQQIAIGTDKNKAAVLADEFFISAWEDALTKEGVEKSEIKKAMDAALNDAMSAVGRNRQSLDAFLEEETNIRDNGVTSFPAIWLLETMANAANRQDSQFIKIFSRIIYGFAIVPARVLRETAWFSPYGAVRFAYDAIAKKMGKTSPYAQSLGNDLQYRQRLTETITGSIVMLAFAAAMSASTEDEEDKKPFKIVVTGNGPLRNEDPQFYDSWMKKNKANTVNVYFGKTKFTINTMRGFEAFAWPAMMLGAVDDWHIRKKQKRTTNTPLQMQDAAIVAGNVLSASLRRGPYAFAAKPLFEAYGDRGVESLAKSLAFPAKTIIPVLGSSLASNISNFLNEPVDRRTLEGALWSNIPFIGPTVAPKSLNAFGEPSLSTDMASKIFKLGVPIVYDIPTDRNSIMVHELVLKQGGGPSIPNRSQVAKRLDREPTNKEFEMFVKEYGAEIKRVMSENIEELSAMSGPDYDRAMEYIGNNARDAAQVKLMEAK